MQILATIQDLMDRENGSQPNFCAYAIKRLGTRSLTASALRSIYRVIHLSKLLGSLRRP